jgi:acyl carrier protein
LEVPLRSTFDVVADIIERSCYVPREAITLDSNLLADLGMDSLDVLDLVFAIEETFGVDLPVGEWLHAVQMQEAAAERYFVIREICACIDVLVEMSAA